MTWHQFNLETKLSPYVVVVEGSEIENVYDAYRRCEGFPEYFSRNITSLDECIGDLLDDGRSGLIVVHTAQLNMADDDVQLYRSILNDLAGHPRVAQFLRA